MPELLHLVLRGSHVLIGMIGLGCFWGAALTRKGSPAHRRLGSLFLISVHAIVATSLVSCAWNLLDPEGFTGNSALTDGNRFALRFSASLLGVLATLTWSAAELGARCVRLKPGLHQLLDRRMRTVLLFLGLSGAGLIAIGVVDGFATDWRPRYWACIALGVFAVLSSLGDYSFAKNPPTLPRAWLAKHIGCMIGCGIAYHTALMIAGARRFLPEQMGLVSWVLPTVVGWPAAAILIRRYARQPSDENPRMPIAE